MKRTSLSKAVRTIGTMVLLSVMVSTTMQQGAQAQAQNQLPYPHSNDFACVPLPEGGFFVEFLGITFTPEQSAAFNKISAKSSAQAVELGKEVRNKEIPGALPTVEFRAGIPGAIAKEIGDAQAEMIRKNVSPDEQLRVLTQKYSRYAKFSKPQASVFTPEQFARSTKITADAEAEVMAILRPDQQKVFRANLIRKRQLEACNVNKLNDPARSGTVLEYAASNSQLSTFVNAVRAAGLVETLLGKGPFTVFVPTNEAFAALPKGTLEKLLKPENRDLLRKVLTYHVVSGDLMAKDLRSGRVKTVQGNSVAVQVQNGRVRVNKSNVVKADVDAKNGVIHAIDQVLLPPGL